MKCKYCGKNLIEGAKYCVYCAKPVEETIEKEKEEKESNIKTILIVLVVFLLIIGSIVGYITYNKTKSKNNNQVKEDVVQEPVEQKPQRPSITKKEAKELIDTYYFVSISPDKNLFTMPIDDDTKKNISIKNLGNDMKVFDCAQIEGFRKIENDVCIKNDNSNLHTKGKTIDYDTFNNKYKYLFGKSNELKKENFKDLNNISTWEYDVNKNSFLETYIISGIVAMPYYTTYSVKEISQEDDKLIIKVGYVYMAPKEINGEIILSTIINGEEITYKEAQTKEDNFETEFLNKYLDKLDTYEITFNYEDDHYVFENIKKL